MVQLSGWSNFYVVVGSSAGALIGLQFVVIALISTIRAQTAAAGARAYATPTIVFFSTVLLTAAILSIPHQSRGRIGVELLVIGLAGTMYVARVGRHIRLVEQYIPDRGDWMWFLVLPTMAYVALFVSGALMWSSPGTALDVVGASELLLLFVGVHNAWDGAVYMVVNPSGSQAD
ncbi:MAG: hypothetical protein E6G68_06310 [Actinobacteria bacterium]|nr:MAG: hypothetical protein E6G68_06310 [Actinomycetota bacterium]